MSTRTHEQIEALVDETVGSLEIDKLEQLKAELAEAEGQLEADLELANNAVDELEEDPDVSDDDGRYQEARQKVTDIEALLERVTDQIEAVRARIEDELWIVIDGEMIEVGTVNGERRGAPASIEEGRREWYVAEDTQAAGRKVMEYWEDMADNDPKELACLVGEETLIQWGLGRPAGPGTTMVRSLTEWIALFEDEPEGELARYDGQEREVDFCSQTLIDDLGFTPTVAYRCN